MKSFKLPVGLTTYTVRFRKRVTLNGATCFGLCDFETKTITLDKSLSSDVMLHTFVHEATHAILFEQGAAHLTEDEAFVDAFALGMAKAIKAMPELMRK